MKALGDHLRSSLWPIPLAMLFASVLLVNAAAGVDQRLAGSEALQRWWLHSGSGDDARNLLSTLATSIMTIASLVFSITIVALSLAANQFGSRLVRSYMTDLRTKLSLGFFLLTAVFCLLSLRLVRQEMDPAQVPHVTVTTALGLSVACVLVLVLFLHVVARSFIADEVVSRVARDLDSAVESLPLLKPGQPALPSAEALLPADFERRSQVVKSPAEGYVREVHYEALLAHAVSAGIVLRIDVMAGDYVCKGGWLGRVSCASDDSAGDLPQAIRDGIVVGPERTPVQDLAYLMRHLVDVALRALSPGINDPNTALVVVDRLRGALARLLGKSLPHGVFLDDDGRCRLLGRRHTHADLIAAALRPIRDAAAAQPLVIVAMIQSLQRLAEHATTKDQVQSLRTEAALIAEVALGKPIAEAEARAIRDAMGKVEEKIAAVRSESMQSDTTRPARALQLTETPSTSVS